MEKHDITREESKLLIVWPCAL